MSVWSSIRLGRPIKGRADSPPHQDAREFELDVATAGSASDHIRLIGWEHAGPDDKGESFEVHVDPSNAYALYCALGIAIGQVGRAHGELVCESQCYKLPRLFDGKVRHHPDCIVSLTQRLPDAPNGGG